MKVVERAEKLVWRMVAARVGLLVVLMVDEKVELMVVQRVVLTADM